MSKSHIFHPHILSVENKILQKITKLLKTEKTEIIKLISKQCNHRQKVLESQFDDKQIH